MLKSRELHAEPPEGKLSLSEKVDQHLEWFVDHYSDLIARGDEELITTIEDLIDEREAVVDLMDAWVKL